MEMKMKKRFVLVPACDAIGATIKTQ